MKKVVIAPDSFKETMQATEVCDIIERAFKSVYPQLAVRKIPVADGGEGLVQSLCPALGGKQVPVQAADPYFNKITARIGLASGSPEGHEKIAIIEMAAASGLPLTGSRRNPMETTSYGTGQMILAALDHGCNSIILGIGGSATNDGGIGMAAALGVRFLDADHNEIPLNGGGLSQLALIDPSGLDRRLRDCSITIACDVDNIMCGPQGASYVFGPQKGADPQQVRQLDRNLGHYADLLERMLGRNIRSVPGTGAGGGLAASLLAFCSCEIRPGIAIVLELLRFEEALENADLVITGEGRIDGQSLHGKVPIGVARIARRKNVPVIAIAGSIGEGVEQVYAGGIDAIFSTCQRPASFEEIKKTCHDDLYFTAENTARLLKRKGG